MSPDASISGSPTFSPGPVIESRDVRYVYSDSLPSVMNRLNGSLLVSTYRTGNLVVVSAPRGQLAVSFHTFERPMGVAVRPGWLAVGTRTQVWVLRNAPDIAAKLEPRGQYDACYLTRYSHFTGDIHIHELAWVSSTPGLSGEAGDAEMWFVNTLFSCLCTAHPVYSFAPRWRPPFITRLTPEDRCHLNGLATADGKARYVTALAETDHAHGWRPAKVGGGCVIDVVRNQTVSRGLTLPHSPRLWDGRLLLLHSGLGHLVTVDPENGRPETMAELPGYTRGLAVHGSLAFVGLSKVRAGAPPDGVPIAARPEHLRCGFAVVDLPTGQVTASFEFVSGIDELFDVQVLPGVVSPYLSGPFADRDAGSPLWTLPPSR